LTASIDTSTRRSEKPVRSPIPVHASKAEPGGRQFDGKLWANEVTGRNFQVGPAPTRPDWDESLTGPPSSCPRSSRLGMHWPTRSAIVRFGKPRDGSDVA